MLSNVTIEEDMRDELEITDHPVEGTNSGTTYISDHAFKKPMEVIVRMGFTNSVTLLHGPAAGCGRTAGDTHGEALSPPRNRRVAVQIPC